MHPAIKTLGVLILIVFGLTFPPLLLLLAAGGWAWISTTRGKRRAQQEAREHLEASPSYRRAYEAALWAQQRPVASPALHLVPRQGVPVPPASGRRAGTAPERIAVVSRIRPAARHAR